LSVEDVINVDRQAHRKFGMDPRLFGESDCSGAEIEILGSRSASGIATLHRPFAAVGPAEWAEYLE
jgi:hypothetical protein